MWDEKKNYLILPCSIYTVKCRLVVQCFLMFGKKFFLTTHGSMASTKLLMTGMTVLLRKPSTNSLFSAKYFKNALQIHVLE